MGTFHQGLGDLHGITVIVDTNGTQVAVGRCHEWTEKGILLHDADVHENGANGLSKDDYIRKSARFGVWKKFESLEIPQEKIVSVKRLGEIAAES